MTVGLLNDPHVESKRAELGGEEEATMLRYRRGRSVIVILLSGVALVATPVAVRGAEPDIGAARHVDGTETMPLPPGNKEMARLAALNHEPVINEGTQDVTTAVVTHTVHVRATADEEYRSHYGSSGWKTQAGNVIETADTAMTGLFGIDMLVPSYVTWDSGPDTSRTACNLRSELQNEIPLAGYDVVAGFSKNATSGPKGCSGSDWTITLYHGDPDADDETYAQWTVQRHEFSHLYGAPDRSTSLPNHPVDIMENQYTQPNFYCTTAGYNDRGIVNSNAAKYDH